MLLVVAVGIIAPLSLRKHGAAGVYVDQEREARSGPTFPDAPTNQIIVKYRSGVTLPAASAIPDIEQLRELSEAGGSTLEHARTMSGEAQVLRLPGRMPAAAAEAVARRIAALPDVEYAEPDHIMLAASAPNDPAYASQWHYYEQYGANVAYDCHGYVVSHCNA